ncbi:hypothetical protein QJS83_14780 [Bdellovibrio sp. 22V]|uniref:hypothetical protein n=1 Tax=Bdellovibrio sp. 22V TaxID=3044166 RepID=UPI0025430C41|nr:hypothetical protein [Bdellovibrio sp. 22V]WII71728.1 hypothetical protein QJS83_14780 [Bdellovibrio sp. 22V]
MKAIINDEFFEKCRAFHLEHKCSAAVVGRQFNVAATTIQNMGKLYNYSFTIPDSGHERRALFAKAKELHRELKCGHKELCRKLNLTTSELYQLQKRYGYSFAEINAYTREEAEAMVMPMRKYGVSLAVTARFNNVTVHRLDALIKRFDLVIK